MLENKKHPFVYTQHFVSTTQTCAVEFILCYSTFDVSVFVSVCTKACHNFRAVTSVTTLTFYCRHCVFHTVGIVYEDCYNTNLWQT